MSMRKKSLLGGYNSNALTGQSLATRIARA